MKAPQEIVEIMMQGDTFSQWLGIKVLKIELGTCLLEMEIGREMLNGFAIAHGGISFSLADSALAFASNSYGNKAFSIETSISHLKKLNLSDKILAECTEINRGKNVAKYKVEVFRLSQNLKKELVAYFHGTVHISSQIW